MFTFCMLPCQASELHNKTGQKLLTRGEPNPERSLVNKKEMSFKNLQRQCCSFGDVSRSIEQNLIQHNPTRSLSRTLTNVPYVVNTCHMSSYTCHMWSHLFHVVTIVTCDHTCHKWSILSHVVTIVT